jgi:hypothetical protein
MTTTANLTDTVTSTSLDFIMATDWKPKIPRVGSMQQELGNFYPILLTDGTKATQGSFDMVAADDSLESTFYDILASTNVLLLTLPNGDTYYIVWDPASPPTGDKPFSSMDAAPFPPINTWTVSYYEVAAP